jgi:hypothetical protein
MFGATMTDTPPLDRATLVAKLQAVAAKLGTRHVMRAEFRRETGIPYSAIARHFDTYGNLVRAAGLVDSRHNDRLSDEALFRAMREAFVEAGGVVPQFKFDRVAKHSRHTYTKRFGSWAGAVGAFREWVERAEPGFPHMEALRRHRGRAPRRVASPPPDGRRYGPLLGFRALQHAPVNESGVIFLFGLMAEELGFIVDALRADFPDCEARRRVDGGAAWMPVRIEFEYVSRRFREHGHDPDGCDLIVCWQHDWPDCPVEVLELKTAVEGLRGRIASPAVGGAA